MEFGVTHYEIFHAIFIFIVYNIVLSLIFKDEFFTVMNDTYEKINQCIGQWRRTVLTTVRTGFTLAKYGWIFLKFKYFPKKAPVEPPPTINITKISKSRILVEYTFNKNTYKFFANLRRGPSNVVEMRDGDSDVTATILPYLGPNEDWHGMKVTPGDMGLNSLTIMDVMGDETTYEKDQVIA